MLGTELTIRRPTAWQTARAATLVVAGFVVGLIVAVAIASGPRAQPQSRAGAPGVAADSAPSVLAAYRQTVANLAVAVRRHDGPNIARFVTQLENRMTANTILSIYAERSRLLGNLASAGDQNDHRMALAFHQQLTALCPSVEVRGAPAFCQ